MMLIVFAVIAALICLGVLYCYAADLFSVPKDYSEDD